MNTPRKPIPRVPRYPRGLERITRDRWRQPGGMRALSRALGVSRTTLYSWFRGDTAPDTAALGRLARLLDVSPTQLLEELEAPTHLVRRAAAASLAFDEPVAVRTATIGQFVRGQRVAWCEADEPVGPAAHRLYRNNYSQMPVRDRGTWTGLLTGEVVTRWMAGHAQAGLVMDDRTPIREVMAYAEDPENFELVPPSAPTHGVADLLARRAAQGRPVPAVLVTAHGSPEAELQGIVTPYDIPRLRRAL